MLLNLYYYVMKLCFLYKVFLLMIEYQVFTKQFIIHNCRLRRYAWYSTANKNPALLYNPIKLFIRSICSCLILSAIKLRIITL